MFEKFRGGRETRPEFTAVDLAARERAKERERHMRARLGKRRKKQREKGGDKEGARGRERRRGRGEKRVAVTRAHGRGAQIIFQN